jgi:hypothetical protein
LISKSKNLKINFLRAKYQRKYLNIRNTQILTGDEMVEQIKDKEEIIPSREKIKSLDSAMRALNKIIDSVPDEKIRKKEREDGKKLLEEVYSQNAIEKANKLAFKIISFTALSHASFTDNDNTKPSAFKLFFNGKS